MELTGKQIGEFEEQGFTLIDDVFSADEMDAAIVAIDELHADKPQFIGNIEDKRLLFLFHDERIEAIAKHILAADHVVHAGNTSLHRSPGDPNEEWKQTFEHVDIMYSMDERRARPRHMMCMMMIFIDDLPEGRGNTFVRPGSQLQLSQYLEEKGEEPYKAHPTKFEDLPDLDWADPVPVVATKGQVLAFNTSIIHGASTNITDQPRRMVFSNFSPMGILADISGNHDRRQEREDYRTKLRELFPEDRMHLLEDSYFA